MRELHADVLTYGTEWPILWVQQDEMQTPLRRNDMTTYYAAMKNGATCTQKLTIEDFTSRGYEVKKSRRFDGYNVFAKGQCVAVLASTKEEAMGNIA